MNEHGTGGCALTVVMPAFNEAQRIGPLLRELTAQVEEHRLRAEIVVVDDGSSDSTHDVAAAVRDVRIVRHERNRGRAAAVQTGVAAAQGRHVAVFDADREYLPADLTKAFQAITDGRTVVYCSRYIEASNIRDGWWGTVRRLKGQDLGPWFANWALALTVGMLFNRWYSEHLSGIRIYPRELIGGYRWRSTGFEGDHELAAAALVLKYRITEVPCVYLPRSKSEGKKIRAMDGFKAVSVFLKWRVFGKRLLSRT